MSTSAFVRHLEQHPRGAFAGFCLLLAIVALGGAELLLRWTVRYDPGYYVAYAKPRPGAVLHYPYGTIHYNSDGFPDDEFAAVKARRRVGYLGDSVCYGVGAGEGYRITERLESDFPAVEHMNLSLGIGGAGITRGAIPVVLSLVERFQLDAVVYLMNLNDIVPDADANPRVASERNRLMTGAFEWIDRWRGRSYLYTSLRLAIKNAYVRRGHDVTGNAAELYPRRETAVFRATAARIDSLAVQLRRRGVEFQVWIVPYEMQISDEAARVYAGHGVHWEDDFITGAAQRQVEADLHVATTLDLMPAFLRPGHEVEDRHAHGVGEYFVYNAGDKLDWNHPNRRGHERLAAFVAQEPRARRLFVPE